MYYIYIVHIEGRKIKTKSKVENVQKRASVSSIQFAYCCKVVQLCVVWFIEISLHQFRFDERSQFQFLSRFADTSQMEQRFVHSAQHRWVDAPAAGHALLQSRSRRFWLNISPSHFRWKIEASQNVRETFFVTLNSLW